MRSSIKCECVFLCVYLATWLVRRVTDDIVAGDRSERMLKRCSNTSLPLLLGAQTAYKTIAVSLSSAAFMLARIYVANHVVLCVSEHAAMLWPMQRLCGAEEENGMRKLSGKVFTTKLVTPCRGCACVCVCVF